MIFYFNPENISYAIPLYVKVGCEWLKTKWKIVIDCEPTRRLGVRARNKRNSKRNDKKKEFAEIEKGLWFKQSSLIACNMQLSRGAPAASSSHSNLK